MSYTVHQAKTHLSRLLKEAEAGQEVTILRGKKPVAKLVAVEPPAKSGLPFRLMGAYPEISWAPDAFSPLTDDELTEMGFDYLVGVPLTPIPEEPAGEK
jgi:prevent-host-death family protein